ncbi:hypothetical protein GGU11DRAFT_10069 [Lentinula aff. detonsa]|nr:hypothetical protein GGU11DRAFT_10069 [Lentinula aff. detonsa]
MDYYGFPQDSYELKFKSRGDKQLAERLVALYKEVNRPKPRLKPRLNLNGAALKALVSIIVFSFPSVSCSERNWRFLSYRSPLTRACPQKQIENLVKLQKSCEKKTFFSWPVAYLFTTSKTSVPSHPTLRSPYTILFIRLS